MSVRTDLAAKLRNDWRTIPALAGVRVVATERALDDIKTPTALIRQTSIGKSPDMPYSHRQVGILLTLISAHTDMERAGNQMDNLVPAALDYLDTRFLHDDATAVGYGQRLAYDIPITVLAPKG